MEQVSYNLRLDLKDTGIVNTGFRLKQGDSGMKISVSIFNRGVNVFDSTTVPKIVFKRPDGASVMANMTVGSSVYEYVFVGNELQQPGVEIMDVKFTLPNDRRESSVSCSFVVVPDTITPNTHGSDIYDNDLAELVEEATEAAESVVEIVGDSEAWAIGERNGVPVGPEDPAYHNNSKYWSEQANVTSLAALTDVDLNNPADNDGLVYNGTAQKWENVPIMTKEQWKKNGAYNLACGVFTSKVENGSTWIANPDGSVSVSGEATGSYITSSAFTLKAGTYLVGFNPIPSSGGVITDSTNFTILDSSNNHLTGLPLNDATSKVITVAADTVVKIRLYAYANSSGHTTNTTFYPVITTDLNATVADFVSPAKTNRELTESAIFGNLTRISNLSVTLSMADATKTVNISKPYKMYLLVLAYNGSYKSTLLFPNGLNYYIDGNPTNLNYNSTVEASVNSTNDTATIHLVQIKGWTIAICDIYGIS